MDSEAPVGSVRERVGGGGGSCGGDRGRTEGATGDMEKASERVALPAWSRGREGARGFSVVDDIMGCCGRFVNFRFLGPLLAYNCCHHHRKRREKKIHISFFELRLSFQHFRPLNTPRAAMMTPMTATTSPL